MRNIMAAQYERFKSALEKVSMLDQADLDFGIYRIMNLKRQNITHFLVYELLPQIKGVEAFNYLIGSNVKTEYWYRNDNISVVQGRTHRDDHRTPVIWRNCKEIDNEELNLFFERMNFRTRDTVFDIIYVNGDSTPPNFRRDEEHWKVVLTEKEFAKRMFEDQ